MKISIVGAAGSVGAPTAFYLAAQGLAREIVMIGGKRQNVLIQHAMDISTAVSSLDIVVRNGDYPDMAGSDIVINAAGVLQGVIADRMEMLPKNISLIRDISEKIAAYCPNAFIITSTNPVDPLNYATYRAGGFKREKLIGYSYNDSFRFREMLAAEFKARVSDTECMVIGEHGSSQVPLFSTARINGKSVAIAEETKQKIISNIPNILKRYEALKSGRTAGWTCAIGHARIVEAIAADSQAVFPCSVVLDGEYGQHDMSISVPVVIGRNGVTEILEYQLAPDEQAAFKVSAGKMAEACRFVDDQLQNG